MESLTDNIPADSNWERLSPILDEAMLRLRDKERDAILLRYFENKSLHEVGAALGVEERAAQKRVARGLEKLRLFFAKRGVALTTTIIGGVVLANSVQAAPAGLVISVAAAAKGSAATVSTLTLVKGALEIMAWTKAKTAVVATAGILLATGAITIVLKHPASTPASGDQPAEPKILWTVGKTYTLRSVQTRNVEVSLPGQPQPRKRSVNLSMDYNVSVTRESANSGRELELSFASQQLDIKEGNRQITHFDSRDDAGGNTADPMIPMLRKLSGFRIRYVTDAAGVVVKTEGVQELMQEATRTVKQPESQELFKRLFGGDFLKDLVAFGEMMPGRTVATGDRWSKTSDYESPAGVLATESQYVFQGLETKNGHQCMHITQTVRLSPKTGANTQSAPQKVKKGEGAGTIWFDPELGMIRNSVFELDAIMEVPARGQNMTLQTHGKAQLDLLDVK